MLAEFTLTPTESKLLIAKGIAHLERVQGAYRNGILAIHPSSSTYYVPRELTGEIHPGQVWVTGCIVPKGLCINKSYGASSGKGAPSLSDPGLYPHTMVYNKGRPITGWTINDLAERMGPKDIYIKGVNAIDAAGDVGVILGSLSEGTIGRMAKAAARRGFEILCPAGYEKLIPGSVKEAAAFISHPKDYSMGVKVSMLVIDAVPFTELDALKELAGVEARVFSCGGLEGAEGSVTLAVNDDREKVSRAIEVCESVKGARLPTVVTEQCVDCRMATCHLTGTARHWTHGQ